MSDVEAPPGWWLASDGRWYAPELHPAAQASQPPVQVTAGPTTDGRPHGRWMIPVLGVLAFVSLGWFAMAAWVTIRGNPAGVYFEVFMGLLFGVALWFNYRTYRTRVAPFNRTPSVLDGLPSFGSYQPGGAPATSGNRWMNFARYSFRLRFAAIVIFGGMIFAYNVGLHFLDARASRTFVSGVATSSTPSDVLIQAQVIKAATVVRGAYVANHDSFVGLTPATLNSQPGTHYGFVGQGQLAYDEAVSAVFGPTTATLAAEAGGDVCWFARINMHVDGGEPPNGVQFVGTQGSTPGCTAASAPVSGWTNGFPPERA